MGPIDDHGGPLPPDDQVVAALRVGDERTFRLLLGAWSPGLIRTARSYVANAESAEDVVQDTWLAVLRGIDRFEARSSLRTWVYRILINRAKSRGVREHRTVPVGDLTRDDIGPTVDPAIRGRLEDYHTGSAVTEGAPR